MAGSFPIGFAGDPAEVLRFLRAKADAEGDAEFARLFAGVELADGDRWVFVSPDLVQLVGSERASVAVSVTRRNVSLAVDLGLAQDAWLAVKNAMRTATDQWAADFREWRSTGVLPDRIARADGRPPEAWLDWSAEALDDNASGSATTAQRRGLRTKIDEQQAYVASLTEQAGRFWSRKSAGTVLPAAQHLLENMSADLADDAIACVTGAPAPVPGGAEIEGAELTPPEGSGFASIGYQVDAFYWRRTGLLVNWRPAVVRRPRQQPITWTRIAADGTVVADGIVGEAAPQTSEGS